MKTVASLRQELQGYENDNSVVVAFGYTKVSTGELEVYQGTVEEVKEKLVFLNTDEGTKSFRIENILNHVVKTYAI